MLSLKGARQISGNNVTMSILMGKKTSNAERPTSNIQNVGVSVKRHGVWHRRLQLFHNLEQRALAVTCSRTGQQGANSMNRLTRAANHTAHIAAPKLQFEGDRSAVRNFREHHVVRKFDQLANNELQKFSHPFKTNHETASHKHVYPWTNKHSFYETSVSDANARLACSFGRRG